MSTVTYKTNVSGLLHERTRLLELIKTRAMAVGEVTILSSGMISDLYVDAKMVTLDPEGAFLTGKILAEILKSGDIDAIGGMTMGADPIVGALAAISYQEKHPVRTFIVRKEPKKHGKKKWIEGPLHDNDRIAIIDDVTTTGSSIMQAIKIIKENTNCEIVKVITLVDRLEGAAEYLSEHGYELISVFNRHDLLQDDPSGGRV